MPVARFWQVQPPCRERLHPLPGLPHTPTHDANFPRKPPHYGTVPKLKLQSLLQLLCPPTLYPFFLAEEAGTTEKEPRQKTSSVPPFIKDMAFRGLAAPLNLIASSDNITFLSSCTIHNMLWTRAGHHIYAVASPTSCLVFSLRCYCRLNVSIWTSHWHLWLEI